MQKGKNIVLPLVLGAASISNKQSLQTLSTTNLQVNLALKCKLLKSLYWSSTSKIYVNNLKYQRYTIQAGFDDENNQRTNSDLCFVFNQQSRSNDQIIIPPFKAKFTKDGQELTLSLQKQIIHFSLFPVLRSKFVKNDRLEEIIKRKSQAWGRLSMDKSQRIMLEPQNTNFPVIGFWISSHQQLQNSCNMMKFVDHLHDKSIKKCFFASQGRKFFYLVKLNFCKNAPELYLVQWRCESQVQKNIVINKKDAFTKEQIMVSSNEQAILQFTLRSDEKVPQTLLNLTCSPIKFPTYNSEQQSSKCTLPDSPRFKLEQSEIVEQECASLRKLVRSQQIEINDLKSQILRLAAQLRQCKNKNYYNSDELSLSYKSSSKRQLKSKKLTKSDLNYQQPSPNNCQEQATKQKLIDQDIWNKFQLVQK